jgi:hypothetical protein
LRGNKGYDSGEPKDLDRYVATLYIQQVPLKATHKKRCQSYLVPAPMGDKLSLMYAEKFRRMKKYCLS